MDANIDGKYLPILNLLDPKEQFKNIIEGKEVEREFLCEIGKILGNREMIEKWKKCEEISNGNVIKRIKYCCVMNGEIPSANDKGAL